MKDQQNIASLAAAGQRKRKQRTNSTNEGPTATNNAKQNKHFILEGPPTHSGPSSRATRSETAINNRP